MPPRTGQKRGPNGDGKSVKSKKTRFLDPSEDPTNFAEEVESSLEITARKRGVKNEGYDSDSSDDGEGVVLSRRKNADADNDDDDMFATDDKPEKAEASTKKKKQEYLRLGDIEGQEFNDSGESDDESGDDEPEDEDDAERRKKTGMGYELSSFNMREEMEEGKFTDDGSYVRTFDPHGIHDRWMDGVDEKEMKVARRRQKRQAKLRKEKILAEEQELEAAGGKPALELQLLAMLKKGETVLEAFQRLGAKSKSKGKNSKNDKGPDAASEIGIMTDLATKIMALGDVDIYSKPYESLVRSVRASAIVDQNWEPPSADAKFEYKWANTEVGQTEETFGPFGEAEMRGWYQADYFGPAGERVLVRPLGGAWGPWRDVLPDS